MRALLIAITCGACAPKGPDCAEATGTGAVGSCAPPMELPAYGGGHWRLAEERGHPVLLTLSAMWCGFCQRQADHIEALSTRRPDGQPVNVLIEDLSGSMPDRDDLRAWVDTLEITHTATADTDGAAAELWDARSLPTHVAISADGVVAWRGSGELSEQRLEELLDAVLDGWIDEDP